jgi:hypothetical protein
MNDLSCSNSQFVNVEVTQAHEPTFSDLFAIRTLFIATTPNNVSIDR